MDLIYSESMDILKRMELEKKREVLLGQLHGLGNLMRGTLIRARVRCGRKGCVCEAGEKHEKVHLSLNLHGRTRGCYVGQSREEEVASLLREYQRAWHIIEQLTEVNLELVRGVHPGGRRRRQRR